MTTLFNWSSHGGQNEDRMLLQRSQRCHRDEFRHVSISTRQRSLRCWENLRGPFLRATRPMRVGSCARAMADNGKTKGLITPPPKWVSAQLLYVCVTAWQRSRLWSQNLYSLFLRAVRLFIYITLINYITRHNFSPTRSVIIIYITRHNFSPTRSVTCAHFLLFFSPFWFCACVCVCVFNKLQCL